MTWSLTGGGFGSTPFGGIQPNATPEAGSPVANVDEEIHVLESTEAAPAVPDEPANLPETPLTYSMPASPLAALDQHWRQGLSLTARHSRLVSQDLQRLEMEYTGGGAPSVLGRFSPDSYQRFVARDLERQAPKIDLAASLNILQATGGGDDSPSLGAVEYTVGAPLRSLNLSVIIDPRKISLAREAAWIFARTVVAVGFVAFQALFARTVVGGSWQAVLITGAFSVGIGLIKRVAQQSLKAAVFNAEKKGEFDRAERYARIHDTVGRVGFVVQAASIVGGLVLSNAVGYRLSAFQWIGSAALAAIPSAPLYALANGLVRKEVSDLEKYWDERTR